MTRWVLKTGRDLKTVRDDIRVREVEECGSGSVPVAWNHPRTGSHRPGTSYVSKGDTLKRPSCLSNGRRTGEQGTGSGKPPSGTGLGPRRDGERDNGPEDIGRGVWRVRHQCTSGTVSARCGRYRSLGILRPQLSSHNGHFQGDLPREGSPDLRAQTYVRRRTPY